MQVAQTMAGFTLGKADNLRKAISKKKGEELRRMQAEFISGALRKGYDEALAQKVYALIMKFANYGFNRSHSVAYGMIAYQLAYLKANAPLYFFNSLLKQCDRLGDEKRVNMYLRHVSGISRFCCRMSIVRTINMESRIMHFAFHLSVSRASAVRYHR